MLFAQSERTGKPPAVLLSDPVAQSVLIRQAIFGVK
jgi:hypothetical protein